MKQLAAAAAAFVGGTLARHAASLAAAGTAWVLGTTGLAAADQPAVEAAAIGLAALRGGAIVGEHMLSFTSDAEQITLAHRAFDRASFAAGAVRAALWTQGRAPGLYSMMDVLGMTGA